jgi:hypothetical protein
MIACPYNVPKFEWDSPFPRIRKCQLCDHLYPTGGYSACCKFCPTGASIFGPVDDLLEETRRRLKMTPGQYYEFPVAATFSGQTTVRKAARYVEHVYGENEVGGSQILYMAGVEFTTLGLPELPAESYVALSDGIQYAIYKGLVYPIVVLGGLIYMVRRRDVSHELPHKE